MKKSYDTLAVLTPAGIVLNDGTLISEGPVLEIVRQAKTLFDNML